ncbi:MAG: hypothetical protein INR71_05250 [Terriglobus roseus]|nr:hypothetical protein [Terriglobus roseus]
MAKVEGSSPDGTGTRRSRDVGPNERQRVGWQIGSRFRGTRRRVQCADLHASDETRWPAGGRVL